MTPPKPAPTLDLHGYKLDDAESAVDEFLYKHNNAGTGKIRIMTGKGTGAIRDKVIKYLQQGGFPWSYEKLPNGQPNQGVLVVHLE